MKLSTSFHQSLALLILLIFFSETSLCQTRKISERDARLSHIDTRGWRITTDATPLPGTTVQQPTLMKMQDVPGDENWANLFGLADLDGDIFALVSGGSGSVYVGGSFKTSGQVVLNGIARWTGTNWSSLGDDALSGVNGVVYAIAVNGSDIYVGGKFTKAGGAAVNNIAKWSTTTNSWSALGVGISGDASAYVSSITINGSDVYVGGWFSTAGGNAANNVAKWNTASSTWSALTSGTDGDVLALAVKDNSLYVGGSFTRAGGQPASNIVGWDMSSQSWKPLIDSGGANGLNGYVNTIAVGKSDVYIGGSFLKTSPNPTDGSTLFSGNLKYKIGPDTSTNIIRWTGTRWLPLSNIFDRGPAGDGRFIYGYLGTDAVVRAITLVSDTVYVSGTFTGAHPESMTTRTAATSFVGRWAGGGVIRNIAWSALGAGTNGYVNALAGTNGKVFVGGSFRSAGNLRLSRIARWNTGNNTWSPLREGPSGSIPAIALHGSDVWAASNASISRWNGKQWQTVGSNTNGKIYAMAISGDDIYVGGLFTRAGTTLATNIARYNIPTDTWYSLGAGVGGIGTTYVTAITISGSNVYVGGDFTIADVVSARSIARWDGSAWHPVGTGIDGSINAIAVAANGDIYAGGDFATAGSSPAREIARWNGSAWSALGAGLNDVVRAIAVNGGNVYVGGDFTLAGSVASRGIAQWDGSQWKTMSGGLNGGLFPSSNSISISGSSVYVGGDFEQSGGITTNHIARWDGAAWHPLGSGTDDQVRSTIIAGANLYIAGDFNQAGAKPSYKFGQWTAVPNAIRSDDEGSGSIALREITPNPATTMTKVSFRSDEGSSVRVAIYDASGHEVARLLEEKMSIGEHEVSWDASNASTGIYFCRLEIDGHVETHPIIVQR